MLVFRDTTAAYPSNLVSPAKTFISIAASTFGITGVSNAITSTQNTFC